jgi:hypothetical protein
LAAAPGAKSRLTLNRPISGKNRKNVRFEPKLMIDLKNISYTTILHPAPPVKETSRWPAAALAASQELNQQQTGLRP